VHAAAPLRRQCCYGYEEAYCIVSAMIVTPLALCHPSLHSGRIMYDRTSTGHRSCIVVCTADGVHRTGLQKVAAMHATPYHSCDTSW
jgi:hypothetical protein